MAPESVNWAIEMMDILDAGSVEIEVKCSNCGKKSKFPFFTLIRRDPSFSGSTYREFCCNSCFIEWLLYMAPKFNELKEAFPNTEIAKKKALKN